MGQNCWIPQEQERSATYVGRRWSERAARRNVQTDAGVYVAGTCCTRGRTRTSVLETCHTRGRKRTSVLENVPHMRMDADFLVAKLRTVNADTIHGHRLPSCRSPSVVRYTQIPHPASPTHLDYSSPIAWPPGVLDPTNTTSNMSSISSTPLYLSRSPLTLLSLSLVLYRRSHSFLHFPTRFS